MHQQQTARKQFIISLKLQRKKASNLGFYTQLSYHPKEQIKGIFGNSKFMFHTSSHRNSQESSSALKNKKQFMVRHESHNYKNCLNRLLNQTNDKNINEWCSDLKEKIKFKSIENNKKQHESTD